MNISSDGGTDDSGDAFDELGRIVLGAEPLAAILERVVHVAKRALPMPAEVSITLIADDVPTTAAFTGATALALDERQYEAERGPCLDAASSGQRILVRDTREDSRWPRYAKAAADNGILSSLSTPLPVQQQVVGALNFYAKAADAFNDDSVKLAGRFAAHAAIASTNAQLVESTSALADQMRQAMETRAVIEQAKGIVMRDRGCSADEAFDALVRVSQESHRKLREVAQRLVDQVSAQSGSG